MSLAIPQTPYGALYLDTICAAVGVGASDVHFEPTRSGVDIRFRVLGDMQPPWKRLELEHRRPFLTEVKRQSNLSIALTGRPQDGRASYRDWLVDARVNLVPTLHGEKVVLRLLDLKRRFSLDALQLVPRVDQAFREVLQLRNGVVLISGPTGSGKTTTLYSLLCSLDRSAKNIVTLEDPVEYGIEGLNQIPIDRHVSFGSALRAVLRQDPDVILVGEIRDEETAALAFKAAATGHLVFSTVHANGAAQVVDRLLNLGVDRYTIAENLRFSAAQRLVRTLCPTCSRTADAKVLDDLAPALLMNDMATAGTFKVAVGCDACVHGFVSRAPVVEFLNRVEVEKYLNGEHQSLRPAMYSLRDAVIELAANGRIDVREVNDCE